MISRYTNYLMEQGSEYPLAREDAVAKRMLERAFELEPVYREMDALSDDQTRFVLDAVISAGAYWSPESTKRMRDAEDQISELNDDISKRARELLKLVDRRNSIKESAWISVRVSTQAGGGVSYDEVRRVLEALELQPDIELHCNITELATANRQHSYRDCIRALWVRLENSREYLPSDFYFTNAAFAALTSVAFNIEVSIDNVKKTIREIKLQGTTG